MKRLILLVALMTITGCAQHHYAWSTQTGKSCFYSCGERYHHCLAGTGGGLIGACDQMSCKNALDYCYAGCPDLRQID